MGEVKALLAARVLRLHPARRAVTVTLKAVGPGRCYSGQYAGSAGQLAPVTDHWTSRQVGRLTRVGPTAAGAELDLVIRDKDAWDLLVAGVARIDALVAFSSSLAGDPVDGRLLRIEIG